MIAVVAVSVATLWKAPAVVRPLDAPAISNPADPAAWSRNLATTADRLWLDSHVQTQALYGERVTVLERRGAWTKVAVNDQADPQDAHGYPGWVPTRQLSFRPFEAGGQEAVVLTRTARLHVHGRTIVVSYGTTLPLVRPGVVRTPDGLGTITGASKPLAFSPRSLIAQARRFVGTHYLWGGLSAWGFDCSGLVWDVYRAHGITIPRDADPQYRAAKHVARSALRPGDLLFFGSPSYVEHEAIYVGGDRMLEAPDSAHRVRVVPVRWTYFVGAGRF